MSLRVVMVEDEPLARERLRGLLAGEPDVEVVAECVDGPSAVETLRRLTPDLVFLDIRLPGMDGFAVLEKLGDGVRPSIIFLTAFDEHAVKAFEARALDYLLKPVSRARLRDALQRVRERRSASGVSERRLAVRDGDRVTFVNVSEVDWIEAAGNYAILHCGPSTHILRETMSALETSLPQDSFLRVSRGAIVNLRRVVELRSEDGQGVAVLRDGKRVPVKRALRDVEQRLRET